jgi:hypothetical protein
VNQQAGLVVTDVLEGVLRTARDERERAGTSHVELIAELEAHLAVDHVQRLVLVRVHVKGRPFARAQRASRTRSECRMSARPEA